MTTDTSERGLERLICTGLAGHPCDPPKDGKVAEARPGYGGAGWSGGNPHDYDREFCVDRVQLAAFLKATQPEAAESLALDEDCPTRRKFLARLQGEVAKRGTIDVLRHGIKHAAHDLDLFYGTPSAANVRARERFARNRFTVTRQLRYSRDEAQRALDIGLFINGLPVFTFELKNSLTKQTVDDAVWQYRKDRNPREKLFEFGRCVAHFAVDEGEVRFCTDLKGKASWFLPFNRGWNDGAGNPPNPSGIKTDYLWRDVLSSTNLTGILENYAQVVEAKDAKTGRKKRTQVWPRFHQLDVVRRLLADVAAHGAGRRYLIPALGRQREEQLHRLAGPPTDRAVEGGCPDLRLDHRGHRPAHPRPADPRHDPAVRPGRRDGGHAERAGDLRRFIEAGKKIIISTVQKFPFILDEIGDEQRGRRFAIVIDEAHSSQGGRTSAKMSLSLSEAGAEPEDEEDLEDTVNRLIEAKRLLPNASYFAFTATPKNKTLEIFGDPDPQPDGAVRHHAYHSYTMKQAIREGFILDVLEHYTPVTSYYKLAKTVEDDPEFDVKRAQKKLRRFVEGHEHAIRLKAEIMVDHFHEQVLAKNKIGGEARAMVVTGGVARAIQSRKTPTASWSARTSSRPVTTSRCCTMYVDKTLSGIKAVQTLSRLNRACPRKHDTFVLDFLNDADTIRDAFADYYRATILADETDPDKLHDLQADLDGAQVYSPDQIDDFVERYLGGAEREQLDPILDACVAIYLSDLDEDGQVDFKGKLPSPQEEDLSKGILDAIDMDSYRVEKRAMQQILLPDEDAEIDPVPASGGGYLPEPDLDRLSNILKAFNDHFGDIPWEDADRVRQLITETIPSRVAEDTAFKNARQNSDEENARIEHGKALLRVMTSVMKDDTQLFKYFMDDESFKRQMTDVVFALACEQAGAP